METEQSDNQGNDDVNDIETAVSPDGQSDIDAKPPGYHPVDISDLPPEKQKAIDDRFKYMYRQIKDNERNLREYRTVAQQQSQQIEDLMSGVGKVVDHLETRDIANNEAQIMQKMQDAFESGDMKAFLEHQNRLLDLKTRKATQQKPNRQEEKRYTVHQDNQQMPSLSPEDEMFVDAWHSETDDAGRPLRPWSINTSDDPDLPDPDFMRAKLMTLKIKKENPGLSPRQVLAELDRRMGVKKQARGQTVMGGSLTMPGKKQMMRLSPEQEARISKVAVKTRFAGPGKSDAEHIAAYKKQMQDAQARKGSR